MPLIGQAILDRIEAREWRAELVGGLTLGADPVVSAVARESLTSSQVLNGFLVRKEAKGHGRGQFVEGVREETGQRAIVVEDVCSTGGSALKAIERAREFGFEVVGAVCLVDREMGGREAIEAAGCGFEAVFLDEGLARSRAGGGRLGQPSSRSVSITSSGSMRRV